MKSYEDLKVWHKSMDFAKDVYFLTQSFPKEELYGLTSQLRRSAVSVSSNIAEGCARNHKKEFIQFIGIALGSLAEAKTQLLIAQKIGFINETKIAGIISNINEIGKMLNGLKSSLTNN